MPVDHQILRDFEALLRRLPAWRQEADRRRVAEKALGKDHPVVTKVRWEGTP